MKPIKTGFTYVRRAPYQAFAVVLVMSVTFFVTTLIALLVYGSTQLLAYFETRPQIIAFLKTDITDSQIDSLKEKYTGDSRVKELSLVTKEKAFELYKSATADNPLLGQLVSPSIFPASLEVSVKELSFAQGIVEELNKEESVESVGFTASVGGASQLGSVIERLRMITQSIRIAGVIVVAVLMVTSLFVLLVVMSMRISMRRSEIESLSLLGATNAFIRNPILVEAGVYALLGVFVGWFAAGVGVMYASPTLVRYFGAIEILPHSLPALLQILGVVLVGEVVVGFFIAVVGATGAVARSLRMVQ